MAIRRELPDEWVEARLIEHLGKRDGVALSNIWLRRRPVFVHRENREDFDLATSPEDAEFHVAWRMPSVMDRARTDWRAHLEQERLRRAEDADPEPSL